MKPGRVPCCVPFCKRTNAGDPTNSWWCCGRHWRAIPLKRRRAYERAVFERTPEWWAKVKPTRFTAPRHRRTRQGGVPRSIEAVFRLGRNIKAEAARRAL